MKPSDLQSLVEMRVALRTGQAQRLRTDARLSRSEVAAAVGVSREAVQKWELGDRVPRGEPAIRYARLLAQLAQAPAAAS